MPAAVLLSFSACGYPHCPKCLLLRNLLLWGGALLLPSRSQLVLVTRIMRFRGLSTRFRRFESLFRVQELQDRIASNFRIVLPLTRVPQLRKQDRYFKNFRASVGWSISISRQANRIAHKASVDCSAGLPIHRRGPTVAVKIPFRSVDMSLSLTASYAVKSLVSIAIRGTPRPVPCKELATAGQMPERFLLHVLRRLVEQGVLQSTRGAAGGYRLARPPSEITLAQILTAIPSVESPLVPNSVGLDKTVSEQLERSLNEADLARIEVLSRVTLAELIAPQ